ncbi:MAG TPA: hypothetical protein ENO22_13490 [candidate division Zixibacteria bacterium]|nr:hypothetical protein [candidate division Zixibacteria bacterium]HER00348.1 hypothetical protein [candidate division Zixibacteria bacterium]
MKKMIVLLLLAGLAASLVITCNETRIINTNEDDLILKKAAAFSIILPSQMVAGEDMQFRIILDAGFPCYTFARYDIEEVGGEIFITPMVYQRGTSCTNYTSRIDRSMFYRIDEPGKYLFHFYESELSYKHYEIEVEPASGE